MRRCGGKKRPACICGVCASLEDRNRMVVRGHNIPPLLQMAMDACRQCEMLSGATVILVLRPERPSPFPTLLAPDLQPFERQWFSCPVSQPNLMRRRGCSAVESSVVGIVSGGDFHRIRVFSFCVTCLLQLNLQSLSSPGRCCLFPNSVSQAHALHNASMHHAPCTCNPPARAGAAFTSPAVPACTGDPAMYKPPRPETPALHPHCLRCRRHIFSISSHCHITHTP